MPREISVGWTSRLDKLEDSVIYVDIRGCSDLKSVHAEAYSAQPFKFTVQSMAGDTIHRSGTTAKTTTGDMRRSWERPYKEFLEELVKLNDGVVNYTRLVEDVAFNDAAMRAVVDAIRAFRLG